jgi:hypothetical protein
LEGSTVDKLLHGKLDPDKILWHRKTILLSALTPLIPLIYIFPSLSKWKKGNPRELPILDSTLSTKN